MDEMDEDMKPTNPDLGHLIEAEPGPAATVDNIRAMLGRHSRRRRRFTSAMAAVALAVGVGGGVAIGEGVAGVTTGSPLAAGNHSTTSAVPAYPQYARSTGKNGAGAASAPSGLSWATGTLPADTGQSNNDTLAPSVAGNAGDYATRTAAGVASPISCQDAACRQILIARAANALQRLFERTANGVTLRAYALSFDLEPLYEPVTIVPLSPAPSGGGSGSAGAQSGESGSAPSRATTNGPTRSAMVNGEILPIVQPGCLPSSELELEVSDAGAVGVMTVPDVRSTDRPLSVVEDQIFGAAENAPMEVLAVRTGAGVASVEARFSNGSMDSMAAVDGWAVLATTLPESALTATPIGTAQVTAYGRGGNVLETASIPETSAYAIPTMCVIHSYPVPQGGRIPNMPTGAPTKAPKPAGGSGGATPPTAGSLPRQ